METIKSKNTKTFIMHGNWDIQSKQLKKTYSQLTDEDLKFETGKENELLSRIEAKLNKDREDVISIIQKSQPEKIQAAFRAPTRSL